VLDRVSEPEDVAAAIAFLYRPESRQITRQMIHTSAGTIV
jgi:NAD(P)-dependent dehydrogenase (short-subunit alcohol dehydrogenase family)